MLSQAPVEGVVCWICQARTSSIIIFWVSVIMKRSQLWLPPNVIYQKLKHNENASLSIFSVSSRNNKLVVSHIHWNLISNFEAADSGLVLHLVQVLFLDINKVKCRCLLSIARNFLKKI